METLDITPTWEQASRVYLTLLEAGNAKGQKAAKEELLKMARIADRYVALQKKGEDDEFIKKDLLSNYMKKESEG